MIRDSIKAAQLSAMKAGDKPRLAAVRLILAKLKDRDIELRTASALPDDDATVVDVLQKMAKQRRESIGMYVQGGRQELADAESAELAVIEEFMPQQLSEADTIAAIEARLQVGTTPGNPILVQQWNEAQSELDRINGMGTADAALANDNPASGKRHASSGSSVVGPPSRPR